MKSQHFIPGRIASVLILLVAASSAFAEPLSTSGSNCAAFLAAPNATSPEEAIADAWIEIVLMSDRTELEAWALSTIFTKNGDDAIVMHALRPPSRLLDTTGRDGLSQLQAVVELLQEQGTIDLSKLAENLAKRAMAHAVEPNRTRDEQREQRKTPPNPVRVVHTGGNPQYDLIRLSTGGFAASGGRAAFILNADGSGLVQHEFPDDFVYSLIELRDGSLATVSQNAIVYRFDRHGNRINDAMLAGRFKGSPVELRDGRLVVGNISGVLFFVDPAGNMTGTYDTEGTIQTTPIQLSTNGNIVVTSDDACVHFLDEAGNLLEKTCTNYAFELSPIELSNGNVFAVNPRGHGYIFDPNGKVLEEFERDWVVHAPLQGPNGTIALATDEGKIIFLDETGKPTGRSYDTGDHIASPLSAVAGDRIAFADHSGRIHVIDWEGRDLLQLSRPEKIYAPIRDAGPDTLVAATEKGDVLFIDLKILGELGR